MATIIKAGNAASGFSISGDNTGTLALNTGTGAGTTAMTVDASQNVAVGGAVSGNKFTVQRAAGSNSVGEAYLTDGTQWILQNSNTTIGSYNSAAQTGDANIIYSSGTQNNGAFLIGQWSSTAGRGIRIDGTGNFQFNSGYGTISTAYGCRAWVNFDGTLASPITPRASGNVSSVTKSATGVYVITFTSAMPDANYCAASLNASDARYTAYSTATASAITVTVANSAPTRFDANWVNVAIFR